MKYNKLPIFPSIKVDDIPPCSVLSYFGAMPLTAFYGNYRFKFGYKPCPYHSAFFIWRGLTLQVGKFKTIQRVEQDFTEKRRIDVIVYNRLTPKIREDMAKAALLGADEPKWGFNNITYGWTDFLRFEPLLRWLPKGNREICSENVFKTFAKCGLVIADRKNPSLEVAPWDIQAWAMSHPERCTVYTVWIGKDFKHPL